MTNREKPELPDDLRHIIDHSLGLTRSKESYRNHYCASRGSEDDARCIQLVELGLMQVVGTRELASGLVTYQVTPKGRAATLAGCAALLREAGKPVVRKR